MSSAAFGRWLLLAGAVISVLAVGAALVLIGSPSAQRESRLDAARIRDLAQIEALATQHLQLEGRLPASLAALTHPARTIDPVSGTSYGYTVIDARTLRLCATFTTDSSNGLRQTEPWRHPDWHHARGDTCFTRRIERRGRDAAAVSD